MINFRQMALRLASFQQEAGRKKKPRKPKLRPRRVSQPKMPHPKKDPILAPGTEYSCQADISFSADFEGNVSKGQLTKKLRQEIISAIKESVSVVAREFQIQATGILVKPLKVECVINSVSTSEEDILEIED